MGGWGAPVGVGEGVPWEAGWGLRLDVACAGCAAVLLGLGVTESRSSLRSLRRRVWDMGVVEGRSDREPSLLLDSLLTVAPDLSLDEPAAGELIGLLERVRLGP